jgi:hypothetical protein
VRSSSSTIIPSEQKTNDAPNNSALDLRTSPLLAPVRNSMASGRNRRDDVTRWVPGHRQVHCASPMPGEGIRLLDTAGPAAGLICGSLTRRGPPAVFLDFPSPRGLERLISGSFMPLRFPDEQHGFDATNFITCFMSSSICGSLSPADHHRSPAQVGPSSNL